MMRSWGTTAAVGDCVALEAFANQAGAAMACVYSSSDEFEAALISERRAAGIYGPRRHRPALIIAVGVAAALMTIVFI